MLTTSYQSLIDSKANYDAMLSSLGIKDKNNRWAEAYKLVTELEIARHEDKIDQINPKILGRIRFALTDIDNLSLILKYFEGNKTDKMFQAKFREMLGGSLSQIDEVNSSSLPRNTQFELLMCAKFRHVGLNAYLGNTHPDVLVRINDRQYGFECKRIYNFNKGAVQKNIEKAILQLNNHFLDVDWSKRGIILLCLDRYVTGGNQILLSKNESSFRAELDKQITDFVASHSKRWYGAKVSDARLLGVLLFINLTGIVESEMIPVNSHYFGASNNGWAGISKDMFRVFVDEIVSLLGPLSR